MHTKKIIASSLEMRHVVDQLDAVAKLEVSVFIRGESGTGKELAAQRLHAESPRAPRSFVAVNCSAIPDTLLESELFGYARGAFTGAQATREGLLERADGGTLFLDEVADLSLRAQTALLRAIQEKEYRRLGDARVRRSDFRLVSATHKDLDAEVAEGRFRRDLLYRLRVVPVEIPPLRDRPADITTLARHHLQAQCRVLGVPSAILSANAEAVMVSYEWPGNVRELENEIVRALIRAKGERVLEPHHFSFTATREKLRRLSHDYERRIVAETLASVGGNRTRAARALGLSRQGLYRKLKRLGVFEQRG